MGFLTSHLYHRPDYETKAKGQDTKSQDWLLPPSVVCISHLWFGENYMLFVFLQNPFKEGSQGTGHGSQPIPSGTWLWMSLL